MTTELPAPFNHYSPNEIIVYGLNAGWFQDYGKASAALTAKLDPLSIRDDGDYQLKMELRSVDGKASKPVEDSWSVAVAYGYAYEGQCYRFDRPKMLMFRAKDVGLIDAVGCGFGETETLVVPAGQSPAPGKGKPPTAEPGYPSKFYMWRVTKLQQIIEVSVETDFAEKIVLDANLPGNKAPKTYAGNMQLGHRSGRLTD